jgi:hypothetical protein
VASLDRKAARFSLAATIAAWSVVGGIVLEDWDNFVKLFTQPSWVTARSAIGGFIVAIGIALEIWFSSRSSSAERKIRDWYALRVAELDLARAEIEERIEPRRLSLQQQRAMADVLRPFKGNTRPVVIGTSDVESRRLAKQIVAVLRFAGLKVLDPSRNLANIASEDFGIRILRYHSDDEDLATALADALTSIGGLTQVSLVRVPDRVITNELEPEWASSIRVIVEPKPIPVIQDTPFI